MASVECRSSQPGVASVWVEIEHVTDAQVASFRQALNAKLATLGPSDAVARVFVELAAACPKANPSDLWRHIIYPHLLASGWSDNRWKRVSGFALERALVLIYAPRLEPLGIRMHIVSESQANEALAKMGVVGIQASKIDLLLEGRACVDGGFLGPIEQWIAFGSAHVKSSIAERIQDDVPASRAFMELGYTSVAITLDAKSYPPPHGSGVNYGELGGRSIDVDKQRIKRRYVEHDGQFDGMFSFNHRTPESPDVTQSGKRIFTLGMHDLQPDKLVAFLAAQWEAFVAAQTLTLPQI